MIEIFKISTFSFSFLLLFVLVSIWTIFWKASALWFSAKNGEFKWFIVMMILNTMGILEIIYILFIKKMKFNFSTWRFESQPATRDAEIVTEQVTESNHETENKNS